MEPEEDGDHGGDEIYDDEVLEVVAEDGTGDVPMDEDSDEDGGDGAHSAPAATGPDTSVARFTGHSPSEVFTVDPHPVLPHLCASGGADDAAYVWDVRDGTVASKVEGHSDSVVCVRWSRSDEPDGTRLLASGGMDGVVKVVRAGQRDGQVVCEDVVTLEGPEVVWLDWHPRGAVLIAGGADGTVWMWQLPQGRVMNVFSGHTASVTAGLFAPDGKTIVTVSEDSSLIVWDPRTGSSIQRVSLPSSPFPFPSPSSATLPGGASCLSLAPSLSPSSPSSPLAIVGGTNGGAMVVVNLTSGAVVHGFSEGHRNEEEVSVESVVCVEGARVGGGKGLVVSGATDGRVCIWDLATYKLRTVLSHDDAITGLALSGHSPPLLTTSSADGSIKTWDLRTGSSVATHTGHSAPVHSIAWSLPSSSSPASDGGWLVGASDDGTARVFALQPQ